MRPPKTAVAIGRCDDCGQTQLISDREPGHFQCRECYDAAYGARDRHETVRLFEPAPAQLPGQTTMEGLDR